MIIQSGGDSTRMGEDKALRDFLGRPLIQHILDRFSPLGQETCIITNDPEEYRGFGYPLYSDVIPDRGALGGLYTALKVASQPHVGLVACDMPFASPKLMRHLHQVLQETKADAVLPSTEHSPEPMHAIYRRESCLPLVKQAIEADQWRMISWHAQGEVVILSPQETQKVAPDQHTFWNLNTPDEFRKAEEVARGMQEF